MRYSIRQVGTDAEVHYTRGIQADPAFAIWWADFLRCKYPTTHFYVLDEDGQEVYHTPEREITLTELAERGRDWRVQINPNTLRRGDYAEVI